MPDYRMRIIKPSDLRDARTSRPANKKSSYYKVRLSGSFFAWIFLLAIFYGRSQYFTLPKHVPKKKEIDYSRSDWMKKFDKIQAPSSSPDLPENDKNIKTLILILKDYHYWEKEVHLARIAKDKKKEKYALSNYRQAMSKISRYSDDVLKKAEDELEKSGWNPSKSNITEKK